MAHLRKKRVLVWKLEGKKPLRRTSRRRETNVNSGSQENRMGRRGLDSSGSRHRKVAGCYAVVIERSGSI